MLKLTWSCWKISWRRSILISACLLQTSTSTNKSARRWKRQLPRWTVSSTKCRWLSSSTTKKQCNKPSLRGKEAPVPCSTLTAGPWPLKWVPLSVTFTPKCHLLQSINLEPFEGRLKPPTKSYKVKLTDEKSKRTSRCRNAMLSLTKNVKSLRSAIKSCHSTKFSLTRASSQTWARRNRTFRVSATMLRQSGAKWATCQCSTTRIRSLPLWWPSHSSKCMLTSESSTKTVLRASSRPMLKSSKTIRLWIDEDHSQEWTHLDSLPGKLTTWIVPLKS